MFAVEKGINHYAGKRGGRVSDPNAITQLPLFIENAIVVNTGDSVKDPKADYVYILIGAYQHRGGLYVGRAIVNHYADRSELTAFESMTKLTSATAIKKKGSQLSLPVGNSLTSPVPSPSFEISVAQLLETVKETPYRGQRKFTFG